MQRKKTEMRFSSVAGSVSGLSDVKLVVGAAADKDAADTKFLQLLQSLQLRRELCSEN